MPLFALSLATLLLAPVIARAARSRSWLLSALDGFVLVSIGALVFLEILPQCVRVAGLGALVAALIGLLGPGLAERMLQRGARETHRAALALALLGLALHASLDGAALARPEDEATGVSLAVAVVVHRLPVALAIWTLVRPTFGVGPAAGLLGLIGVATAVGFGYGDAIVGTFSQAEVRIFEALVAGSLIHVVFHAPNLVDVAREAPRSWDARRRRLLEGVGTLAGVGLVYAMLASHSHGVGADPHGHGEMWRACVELVRAMAPVLLIAYAVAAVVRGWVGGRPAVPRGAASGPSPMGAALEGISLAMRSPVCTECNLPLVERRIRQGTSAAVVLAVLVATPGLSLDALLVSVPLLGVPLALAKLAGTIVLAFVVAVILGRFLGSARACSADAVAIADPGVRLPEGVHRYGVAFLDVVDRTAPWILFGTGIAGVLYEVVGTGAFASIGDAVEVPLLAAAGILVNLGPAGSAPVAAVLGSKGLTAGAALALFLTSPVAGIATIGCLAEHYGVRGVLVFLATVVLLASAAGYAVDALLPPGAFPVFEVESLGADEHDHGHEGEHDHEHPPEPRPRTSGWRDFAAVLVTALVAVSFLRRGPRRFFSQVFVTGEPGDGDGHAHHHHHHH